VLRVEKILDDLIRYYKDQRFHEETGQSPSKRWQKSIAPGKSKLRLLEASMDLDEIFFYSSAEKGKVR
jgi:hypothetical protein